MFFSLCWFLVFVLCLDWFISDDCWGKKRLGFLSFKAWHCFEHRTLYSLEQGEADKFLHDKQLLPENFQDACNLVGIPLILRLQPGYDHSYFFIASFVEEHIKHHAEALCSWHCGIGFCLQAFQSLSTFLSLYYFICWGVHKASCWSIVLLTLWHWFLSVGFSIAIHENLWEHVELLDCFLSINFHFPYPS